MNKEPIRVAQIVGKWVGGGVEAVVMNYYRHIDRSKIQFDFICDEDSTNIPYEEIEKLGGKVILIPPYQKVFKYHKELKRVLKEGNYRIVHSHINTLSVFSLWAAKSAKVPVRIAHSHSTIVKCKKEFKRNILKNILKYFSKTFATDYFACSDLAAISQFGKKMYESGNVTIVSNAIDLNVFKYDEKIRKSVRDELNIGDDTLVIGHVGRFVETKNHYFVVDIFNELHTKNPNSVLVLVGQGPLMDEIVEKVKTLKLNDCVLFLGQRSDINKLYQAFDGFLLPSLYEGLPVVCVEAQAAGLLCLLSDNMTKKTKVLESTKFISLNKSSEVWANEFLKLVASYKRNDTKEEISANGFNIENEGKKLENKYIEMLKPTVIHVVNSNSYSGLEKVACDIISSIESFNCVYVTRDGSIVENLEDKNIKFEMIKKMSLSEIRRVIKKYNPAVIHAHDYTASVVCSLVKKNIPLIEHLHNNSPWLKKICLYSVAFLYAGLRANVILTVSNSIEKEFIFSFFIKKKIKCVDNPLNRQEVLSKSDLKAKKIYDICCVARLSPQKNPQKFIDIIASLKEQIPKIKAVWVGSGEIENSIKQYAKLKNVNSNIEFVGFQKNPYNFLSQSKIFLLTSDWEGFGLAAFEALCFGLPCVVSNVGGLSSLVDDFCGKLCDILTEYILECGLLLSNNEYYNNKAKGAFEKSIKLDNYTNYTGVIIKEYERLSGIKYENKSR